MEDMTDDEFFGTKDVVGFYKKVIAERNKRLMNNHIKERVAQK